MQTLPDVELDQHGPVLRCRPGILAIISHAEVRSNLGKVVRVVRPIFQVEGRKFDSRSLIWEVESPSALLWRVGPAHYSAVRGPVPDVQLTAIHPWPKPRTERRYRSQALAQWARKWKLSGPVPILDHRVATGLSMLGDRLNLHVDRTDPMRDCAAHTELSLYRLSQSHPEEGETPCEF